MNPQATRIFELLKYIEEVEKLKRKPAYTVSSELFVLLQAELEGLPELDVNVLSDDQEAWLRLPRMEEVPPPVLPLSLEPWVTASLDLSKPPVLKSSRGATKDKPADYSDLIDHHPEIKALFDWYVEEHWKVWQAAEKPRRKSIGLYNQLFHLYQTLSSDGVENPVELVWGVGMASWKRSAGAAKVEHPLLTQTCDLRLNEKTFALEISPRQADAKLEIDCYADMEVPGVLTLEPMWKEALSKQASSLNPFESSTYEGILKAAVAHLDPTGRYEPNVNDFSLLTPSEVLVVSNSWVVFARKRSTDIFLEDVRRLQATLEAGAQVPPVINEFVIPGDDKVRPQPEVSFRGLSSSSSGAGVKELYFPLPYNSEQVAIVSKLENNNGVVVQGPPGTGKTHTIANIISHYLALGKRVLVTSKGDTALSVLQEKLPERIRSLSVSLLTDETEGMKQFERSIARIAAEVNALNPGQLQASIDANEEQLNQLHAKISAVDQAIAAEAAKNMQTYTFKGKEVSAETLAQLVMDQMDDHAWFEDVLPAEGTVAPPVTEDDIRELRLARAACRKDLEYVGVKLPDIGKFPSWEALDALHKDMVRAKEIESVVESGALYPLKDSALDTYTAAGQLLTTLNGYIASLAAVAGDPVSSRLLTRLRDMRADDILLTNLLDLKNKFGELDEQRKRLMAMAVEVPVGAEKNADFLEALGRLDAGKSAFAFPLGKGDARKLVAAVQVAGSKPDAPEQWRLVMDAIKWRITASKELARLAAMSSEFGLPPVSREDIEAGVRVAAQLLQGVGQVHALVFEIERNLYSSVTLVFPEKVAAQVGGGRVSDIKGLVDSLQAHLDKGRLGYAMGRVAEYVSLLEPGQGGIDGVFRHFLRTRLGSPDADPEELKRHWHIAVDDLKRLTLLKPSLASIEQTAQKLATGGAPLWAKKICTVEPSADFDPMLPTNWADAWDWRVASALIEQLDVHFRMRKHFEERKSLTLKLSRTYQDVVAERAWLGVHTNSPGAVRQALQSYLTSVQAMGAGTGIRAARHRRNARQAMSKAYLAVPCWILPHWRVSETLPAELGLFDLVIIDEASQSDIWALPALLRGQKLLVVGDEKQVSPSIVGMPEQRIVDIQRRFLDTQPHGKHMTPDMSIYDLSRVVFAGNSVMLREHFRCVAAIIEYSNREFYIGQIEPLRIPKANERLDPPLVDVLVKGGSRKGDKNVGEARAIVNEIVAIVDDPAFEGRTIGVVTLLGTEQSKLIHELIARQISPEEIVARKIVVGPPPMFQGRERDIMMVSMVIQKGDPPASNVLAQQQRFNVALSRARDRTYLFRSIEDGAVNPQSLTGKLLTHFRKPFANDAAVLLASRDRCDSGFEREMFDDLTRRGYRVKPQVECAGFKIDFVVEGAEGRRLAIECDGDRYHGPGQWAADMARQRVLERAGWVFWRCFASSFTRRKQEVLNDLIATLSHLGIEPLGDEPFESSSWVSSKTVDPFGIDNEEPLTLEGT